MTKRRVVVTGLGIVSPVGTGIAQAWDNLVHGVSGVGPITRFDAAPLPTRIAAEVKGFDADAVDVAQGGAPLATPSSTSASRPRSWRWTTRAS